MHYRRHPYGIDFYENYGKQRDFNRRDRPLRPLNKQRVTNALINGLIFQRGVYVCLRFYGHPRTHASRSSGHHQL